MGEVLYYPTSYRFDKGKVQSLANAFKVKFPIRLPSNGVKKGGIEMTPSWM